MWRDTNSPDDIAGVTMFFLVCKAFCEDPHDQLRQWTKNIRNQFKDKYNTKIWSKREKMILFFIYIYFYNRIQYMFLFNANFYTKVIGCIYFGQVLWWRYVFWYECLNYTCLILQFVLDSKGNHDIWTGDKYWRIATYWLSCYSILSRWKRPKIRDFYHIHTKV